jgi:hypothetical protein
MVVLLMDIAMLSSRSVPPSTPATAVIPCDPSEGLQNASVDVRSRLVVCYVCGSCTLHETCNER